MRMLRSLRRAPLVERILYHAARVRAWARRATAAALAVRATIWVAGVAALVLAAPVALHRTGAAVVAAVLAAVAAARPASGWVGTVAVVAVALVALDAWQEELPALRVGLVAGLLYLHHAAAALGAQLRTDAQVPAVLLRHWAGRTGVVLAGAVPVGAAVWVLPRAAAGWPPTVLVAAGVAAALLVTATLVGLAARRGDAPQS